MLTFSTDLITRVYHTGHYPIYVYLTWRVIGIVYCHKMFFPTCSCWEQRAASASETLNQNQKRSSKMEAWHYQEMTPHYPSGSPWEGKLGRLIKLSFSYLSASVPPLLPALERSIPLWHQQHLHLEETFIDSKEATVGFQDTQQMWRRIHTRAPTGLLPGVD